MSSIEQRQATLRDLSFALRHPDTWPKGFEWNYSDCHKCAMGLAFTMWPQQIKEPTTQAMVDGFGIPVTSASEIFTGAGRHATGSIKGVTPAIIADLIDELV